MNIKNFLTDHTYVLLPTKKSPKVYLPIADSQTVTNAFRLYNPFSKKAKLFKKVARFLCLTMRPLARVVFPTLTGKKSKLVQFLENELSKNLTSAVYLATAKDKIVVQLQDKRGILGYLKFPISDLGKSRLLNEQKAIEILSEKKIIPPLLLNSTFENTPFILLKPIDGKIGSVTKEAYRSVLNTFKKEETYPLAAHPRVLDIKQQLSSKRPDLIPALQLALNSSKKEYSAVYEHGDFAPWNLVATTNGIVPFDFEYFEENGLEYLDELKFHFQEQHLLGHKEGKELISTIASKVSIDEFNCIFRLFLLKEIVNKQSTDESIELELSLLKQLPNI